MRELKYNHYRDNDFNGSVSTYNRHYYSHPVNVSNYLSYNNIHHHHHQQQIQIKRLSSRIRQQIHTNQCPRQPLRSNRYLGENQENQIHNSTNKVKKIFY